MLGTVLNWIGGILSVAGSLWLLFLAQYFRGGDRAIHVALSISGACLVGLVASAATGSRFALLVVTVSLFVISYFGVRTPWLRVDDLGVLLLRWRCIPNWKDTARIQRSAGTDFVTRRTRNWAIYTRADRRRDLEAVR